MRISTGKVRGGFGGFALMCGDSNSQELEVLCFEGKIEKNVWPRGRPLFEQLLIFCGSRILRQGARGLRFFLGAAFGCLWARHRWCSGCRNETSFVLRVLYRVAEGYENRGFEECVL